MCFLSPLRFPTFFRRLFAEGAFAQAFVPILGEYREKGSQAAVKELVNRVSGTLGISAAGANAGYCGGLAGDGWLSLRPSGFLTTRLSLRPQLKCCALPFPICCLSP